MRKSCAGPGVRTKSKEHDSLAATMKKEFNRFLIRDGVVAGYGIFSSDGGLPHLLLHPSDDQTGVSYSLLPMTQAIIGGLFTSCAGTPSRWARA